MVMALFENSVSNKNSISIASIQDHSVLQSPNRLAEITDESRNKLGELIISTI
jgi:hypothetical protein